MTITLPHQKIKLSDSMVRRTLMVLLAFIMTHLITYQRLPFTDDYEFPLIPFSIFLVYGAFICETNSWNYRKRAQKSRSGFDVQVIGLLVRTNLFYCTLIFTSLTLLQMIVFQSIINPFRFVGLLGVCLMISLIETGVFILRSYLQSRPMLTLNQVANGAEGVTIVRNHELRLFKEHEIALFIHQDGCVFLVDHEGRWHLTQFDSLTEIEEKLSNRFFRATRQALISKEAIRVLKKAANNKLCIRLSHLDKPLTVSRYKSPALKAWFKSYHSD